MSKTSKKPSLVKFKLSVADLLIVSQALVSYRTTHAGWVRKECKEIEAILDFKQYIGMKSDKMITIKVTSDHAQTINGALQSHGSLLEGHEERVVELVEERVYRQWYEHLGKDVNPNWSTPSDYEARNKKFWEKKLGA